MLLVTYLARMTLENLSRIINLAIVVITSHSPAQDTKATITNLRIIDTTLVQVQLLLYTLALKTLKSGVSIVKKLITTLRPAGSWGSVPAQM